jgi:hypothetical protein
MIMRKTVVLLLATGLCLGQISCGSSKKAPVIDELKPEDEVVNPQERWNNAYGGYHVLVKGGIMYVGTVLSVTVTLSDPGDDYPPSEVGTFRFRVDKIVIRPRHKELTLGYWWMDDDSKVKRLSSQWVCNSGPWKKRPRPGLRLLLLLTGNKEDAECMNGKDGGPVWHVWWGVGANHPLVKDFEDAGKYLTVQDDKSRQEIFTKLCQSEWPSIREFVSDAAFMENQRCQEPFSTPR